MLTQPALKEALEYFPETGDFIWRKRSDRSVQWNGKHAGKRAGCTRHDGYLVIKLEGKFYLGHRLAWLYMTGVWPREEIDHIDGKTSNTKFSNLREASRTENVRNQRGYGRYAKGVVCVNGRYIARIYADKIYNLGSFDTEEQAAEAYRVASVKFHGQFANAK